MKHASDARIILGRDELLKGHWQKPVLLNMVVLSTLVINVLWADERVFFPQDYRGSDVNKFLKIIPDLFTFHTLTVKKIYSRSK